MVSLIKSYFSHARLGKSNRYRQGAKRSQRRFVNVLEPFTHVQLRFRPIRTDELAFILGCALTYAISRAPSRDLQRYGFASYLTELIDVMVAGRESGQELYELLLQGLTALEEYTELPPLFLSTFELLLLAHTGYARMLTGANDADFLLGLSFVRGDIHASRFLSESRWVVMHALSRHWRSNYSSLAGNSSSTREFAVSNPPPSYALLLLHKPVENYGQL